MSQLVLIPGLCLTGVCGAHADRCRPPGGPTECSRNQLYCGEPDTGIDLTHFYMHTVGWLLCLVNKCTLNLSGLDMKLKLKAHGKQMFSKNGAFDFSICLPS